MATRNIMWWVLELIVWYIFFYIGLFAIKNPVDIGWTAFGLVFLGSLGLFASPLTRHLSIWNKILDKIVKKEEDLTRF
jgi:hypothetical protein